MTKDQTRDAMEVIVRACYWGATRRSRLAWVLVQKGIKLDQAYELIRVLLDARMLEDHNSWGWISATPFLLSVLDNWDSLTQDMPWADDMSSQEDRDDYEATD